MNALEIDQLPKSKIRYSICTMVSNLEEYSSMIDSFREAGFNEDLCEFIYIDNSKQNKFEAYEGLNKFISAANGEYILLCHQDIELRFDKIEVLEKRIEELNALDKNWGILSNAGGYNLKKVYKKISHPHDSLDIGPFPQKVKSVDENFILIKKSANLSLSRDLKGFHLYGTDICIHANIMGYNAWVIDFHIFHKSTGKVDSSFYNARRALIHKYSRVFKSRYIRTTCTILFISGSNTLSTVMNSRLMIKLSKLPLKIRHLFKGDYV